MPIAKLTETELSEALASLPEWRIVAGKLHREYQFPDFVHAFAFMSASAMEIEKLNHHPEWFNVWNRVAVDLTTHDSGGITAKDVELARVLDRFALRMS
ncbi:MAG: 4a-hydroxytetrahydrobiopterin dehydratase [Bryobacteraceae bacterium]|nr:4a-hydroxytetrahydrobiopterin dehydratase [Bryobacteraceae bacterium]